MRRFLVCIEVGIEDDFSGSDNYHEFGLESHFYNIFEEQESYFYVGEVRAMKLSDEMPE